MSIDNSGISKSCIFHNSSNTLIYEDIDNALSKLRIELIKHLETMPKGRIEQRELFFFVSTMIYPVAN